MENWKFIYEEELYDQIGDNMCGIISNGDNCLFYHVYKSNEEDKCETCHIYSSILCMFQHENEECSYAWTPENDSILMNYLNSGKFDIGEGSSLQSLEFLHLEECESFNCSHE